jgi:hypothetical protein
MARKLTFGIKITAAQREYYRYTGVSEEVERRGRGSNSHDFTHAPKDEQQKDGKLTWESGNVNE